MAQLIDQILPESTNSESFIANVLFSKPQWDINKFVADVRKEWGLDLSDNVVDDIGLAYKANECLRIVAFVDAKIPYNEAEEAAERQIVWDDAKKIAKSHKAHLIIYVNCKEDSPVESAKLFTKLISCALKQEYATAAYYNDNLLHPDTYIALADCLHDDDYTLPVLNWIWPIPFKHGNQNGILTRGLTNFGKMEIEVCADAPLNDILDFITDISNYILSYDVTFNDGETIGRDENEKLKISISPGIGIDEPTVKIEYPSNR